MEQEWTAASGGKWKTTLKGNGARGTLAWDSVEAVIYVRDRLVGLFGGRVERVLAVYAVGLRERHLRIRTVHRRRRRVDELHIGRPPERLQQ